MIQKVSSKMMGKNPSNSRSTGSNENPNQHWGSWSGQKHYSLEVIQHPIRARMCGFGDKDRRPLAPAAVAKMIVKLEDNTVVDVDDIDVAFFVVTVDLWSSDGKQEMNLVLHPSSTDRYVPTHVTKPRRRGNAPTPPQSSQSPYHGPNQHSSPPSAGGYPFPDQTTGPFPPPYPPYPTHPEHNTGWGYSHPGQQQHSHPGMDRSLNFNRVGSPGPRDGPDAMSYRGWNTEQSFPIDSYESSSSSYPTDGAPVYASAPYGQHQQHHHHPQASFAPPQSASPPPSSVAMPRHTYTRTLVGPLSANAQRLLDEHRKPGIFFLFQDLSIRTEGTFRLRLRLMNVGAPPAPEPGASRVMTGISPVLAQTFTEPFVVYSAKRFPGVPDTTALSIAFGNQGQKLPLRNRHGSRQQGRRRRRDDDSGSEDDSDDS